jgi:hypothetical protein
MICPQKSAQSVTWGLVQEKFGISNLEDSEFFLYPMDCLFERTVPSTTNVFWHIQIWFLCTFWRSTVLYLSFYFHS